MWAVVYDDGTVFTDKDGSPEDAPSFGVIACVSPCEELGREVIHGWDWYYFNEEFGCFWGCDLHGLLDRLLNNLAVSAVKQGRSIYTPKFRELHKMACEMEGFPKKSARSKREHPRQI